MKLLLNTVITLTIIFSLISFVSSQDSQGPKTRKEMAKDVLKKTVAELGWPERIIPSSDPAYADKTFGIFAGGKIEEPDDTYVNVGGVDTGESDKE